jgi:hypothetical protein
MATGTFDQRMRELAETVGSGSLIGSVERNQAYAQVQHEDISLRHPHGGQAKYQETALLGRHHHYLQAIADVVLDGGIERVMAEQMERFDGDSGELTPKDTTVLARSGHPVVRSAGRVVYDRAPEVPRLSPAEERALRSKVRGRADPRPPTGR